MFPWRCNLKLEATDWFPGGGDGVLMSHLLADTNMMDVASRSEKRSQHGNALNLQRF